MKIAHVFIDQRVFLCYLHVLGEKRLLSGQNKVTWLTFHSRPPSSPQRLLSTFPVTLSMATITSGKDAFDSISEVHSIRHSDTIDFYSTHFCPLLSGLFPCLASITTIQCFLLFECWSEAQTQYSKRFFDDSQCIQHRLANEQPIISYNDECQATCKYQRS